MSIKKTEVCVVECNICGKRYSVDNEIRFFANEDEARNEISDQVDRYWEELDGKHYCPDCYEYDDEEETVIPHK